MINRLMSASAVLAVLLSCTTVSVSADRGFGGAIRPNDDDRRVERERRQDQPRPEREYRQDNRREIGERHRSREDDRGGYAGAIKPPKKPGYVIDRRHRHDRYYPKRGYVASVLPPGYRIIRHRHKHYYYHGGVWYRPSGTHFIVVLPPVGLVVQFLPPYYTTIWVGGIPYYYAGGVYYVWRPEDHAYVVTEPPPESEISEQASIADQLFIYPKKGQSEQQQATDRYECHRWAVDQTGFDPTKPGGNVPTAEHSAKRADYQRAMKACLEARGYSVQ